MNQIEIIGVESGYFSGYNLTDNSGEIYVLDGEPIDEKTAMGLFGELPSKESKHKFCKFWFNARQIELKPMQAVLECHLIDPGDGMQDLPVGIKPPLRIEYVIRVLLPSKEIYPGGDCFWGKFEFQGPNGVYQVKRKPW